MEGIKRPDLTRQRFNAPSPGARRFISLFLRQTKGQQPGGLFLCGADLLLVFHPRFCALASALFLFKACLGPGTSLIRIHDYDSLPAVGSIAGADCGWLNGV